MRNVAALTRRELMAYYLSPMAYIVMAVFVVVPGYLFYAVVVNATHNADLRDIFDYMAWVLVFVAPLLTMRLFAEEFQSGTIETLMTAPVTTLEVVLSKYLAALFFVLVTLVPTFVYAGVLFWLAAPDPAPIVAGYFGLLLLGGYFLAIGLVASACMRSQVSAAIVTIVLLMVLHIIGGIVRPEAAGSLAAVLRYASYSNHFYGVFTKGIVDTRDVVYFLSVSLFCVFLAAVVVAVRRWR